MNSIFWSPRTKLNWRIRLTSFSKVYQDLSSRRMALGAAEGLLLGLAAPPMGSGATKLVQSFPNQNANPSITGLTGTLKKRKCPAPSSPDWIIFSSIWAPALALSFRGLWQREDLESSLGVCTQKLPFLTGEYDSFLSLTFHSYEIACLAPFVRVAILLCTLGCKVPGYLVTLFCLPPVLPITLPPDQQPANLGLPFFFWNGLRPGCRSSHWPSYP